MNNPKPKKYSVEWCEQYHQDDSRFYGVIIKNLNTENQTVSVNMERFCDYFHIHDKRKTLKSNKNSLLYKPAKSRALDYNINVIKKELQRIKNEWLNTQKIFIDQFLSEIKGHDFTPIDDDNLQMGYVDFDEAEVNARIKSALSHQYAEYKRNNLYFSLYAQYYHQLAAQIDATIIKLLTENGWEDDKYNRGVLLAFKGPNNASELSIKELKSYRHYEKMYAIWNFLKHNSGSTYQTVKDHCPEVLVESEYEQGDLACFFIQFSNDLIEETINGMQEFLIQYCEIVFGENEDEAGWNHDDFFLAYVTAEINEYIDPMGFGAEFY
ncbi:hypothetical protein [Spirochaeta isovalerica]|uniref:Uncharacterized protein n=1 Tax=Spirochaeta isovalerica TaxID=150 RepID=A0A841RG64_9SPIO|nr:hypothetical protein [Spirochaeta isovalerica]MBB6481528.1 hypothetical protein [Spirochaeta isovalerica]